MSREPVTELSPASPLPRVHPAQQAALNRLYGRAPELPVVLPHAAGVLRAAHVHPHQARIETHGCFRFRVGRHDGAIGFDDVSLATLLGEARPQWLPHELRTILLAEALQPAVAVIERHTRQRIEWLGDQAAEPPGPGALGVLLRGADGMVAARACIHLNEPAALDALVPDFHWPVQPPSSRFDGLVVSLRFEIGDSTLQLHEMRGIARGDIVAIERWQPRGTGLGVQGRLAGRHGTGIGALADGSTITVQSIGEPEMTPNGGAPMPADQDASSLPLDRLDALEVTLRFEIGELLLTLRELKALSPGHVFDLGQPLNRCAVRIVGHGNVLGRGHLVAVGDRLGVRIADFAAGEI